MRPRAADLHPPGPGERLRHWTFAFRAIFVLFILWASANTALTAHAHAGHTDHSPMALMILASTEMVGAVLFLLRPTQLAGLIVLLIVFASATVMAVTVGEMPLRFLYFAATALFIYAVDGSIQMEPSADPR